MFRRLNILAFPENFFSFIRMEGLMTNLAVNAMAFIFRIAAIILLSQGIAQAQLALTTNSESEISGYLESPSVRFSARQISPQVVSVDVFVGTETRIHGDIDYGTSTVRIRSLSSKDGTSRIVSVIDIVACQRLLDSLRVKVDASTRVGDALTSFVNLLSSAPPNRILEIDASSTPQTITSICGEIGQTGAATYTLDGTTFTPSVIVGPVCYTPPALGRCGAGGGPDPGIGLFQRFTQECLNHDQCCVATRDRYVGQVNICGNSGNQCVPEFKAAASSFFFANDCGTTAGSWVDVYGYMYTLTGGGSSGSAAPFRGTVNVASCGIWNVAGTRTGTAISLTATNPSGASATCAASYTYVGTYSNCSVAAGTWSNSAGLSGDWSWSRSGFASAMSRPSTKKGPAER